MHTHRAVAVVLVALLGHVFSMGSPAAAAPDERAPSAVSRVGVATPRATALDAVDRRVRGASISGRVTRTDAGKGGTTVRLGRVVRGRTVSERRLRLPRSGSWSFGRLAPGRYRLSFHYGSQTEYWPNSARPASGRLITVRRGQAVVGRDARLQPATLLGVVTTTSGVLPTGGARVTVQRQVGTGWQPAVTPRTDRFGRYGVSDLAPGTYRVSFGDPSDATATPFRTVLLAHEATVQLDGLIDDAGSVAASVLQHDGRPAAHVETFVFIWNGTRWTLRTPLLLNPLTGADGTVRLTLPSGTYRLGFSLPDAGGPALFVGGATRVEEAADVVVRPGTSQQLEVVSPPPGAVSGRVTDTSGAPIDGVEVSLHDSAVSLTTRTGPDGSYRFAHVMPRTYRLYFARSSYVTEAYPDVQGEGISSARGAPVVVTPGSDAAGLDAVLAHGSVLDGRVVDPTGQPLRHISVWVDRRTETGWETVRRGQLHGDFRAFVIDTEGRFRLKELAKGYYRLRYEAILADGRVVGMADDHGHTDHSDVAIGEEESVTRDVVADPADTISGTVSGLSGAGLEVVVERPSGDGWVEVATVRRPGASGLYSTPRLPPGPYRVRAVDPLRFGVAREVVLAPGGSVHLDMTLTGGAVVDSIHGAPRGSVIAAVRPDGTVAAETVVEGEKFAIGPLAMGNYVLRLSDPRGRVPTSYFEGWVDFEPPRPGVPTTVPIFDGETQTFGTPWSVPPAPG